MAEEITRATYPRKQVARSIALFGAGGRMGREVVEYLEYAAPGAHLRLLTSNAGRVASLGSRYPAHEIRLADYFDRSSLEAAVGDVEGVFVVTPSGLDERTAMTNLVAALQGNGPLIQIVRITGLLPDSTQELIPPELVQMGGDADQHYIARDILRSSNLPVTFLNVGASLMDNLLFAAEGVRMKRSLVWPHREVPLIDVRDLGEIAARLFLSDDARHIGAFHTVNNGYDLLTTAQLAATMADVFRMPIGHDPSYESFEAAYGAAMAERMGRPEEAEYRFKYFAFESTWLWSLNDFAERILGRRPNVFRSWLQEHRAHFLASYKNSRDNPEQD